MVGAVQCTAPCLTATLFELPNSTHSDTSSQVDAGEFTDSEIVVMLGENGTGKTTFIRLLAGLIKPDDESIEVDSFNVSYKPQKISPRFDSTVRNLFHKKIRDSYMHPQFVSDVIKPLNIEALMDQEVQNLSGGTCAQAARRCCVARITGELQRVAITLCLGQPADVYLIDEPSAYLDSEQRIIAAKVIKRFIMHAKKTAFVVEHDFIMATYLADRVVVYEGEPSKRATATTPQSLLTGAIAARAAVAHHTVTTGMNLFLKNLNITFRRDPTNYRPRINKLDSTKDREQKVAGTFYYLED